MKIEPGDLIGHYEIVGAIGSGGMGEVYLANDTKLDRKVGLKILPHGLTDDADRMDRFIREAKTASALNHPNIITIYEINEFGGTRFIATEYVDGEMLRDRLRNRELSIGEVLDIATQVALALSVAHEAGITHRDTKPENIMIRRDGLVKILDFGLAKSNAPGTSVIDSEGETEIQSKTLAGVIMGTVAYMSPEQARGKETDERTDVWSFGCVLYEMLTRQQAFQGETMTDVFANIIYKEPLPISTLRRDTPEDLVRIVARALSKNIEDRYRSAKEILDELKQLQTRNLVETEKSRTGTFVAQPPDRARSFGDSIAVMPFSDISAVDDNRYFSEGLTEEIITNLSPVHLLKVVAHGPAMRYEKEGKSHQQIGNELGVQFLLEGSVRRHGNDLRITAQLINAEHDTYLWAETYRGTMEDIFEIQENVAAEIVRSLRLHLSTDERKILKKRFTRNAEAYQLYLQGRFFWNKRSEDGLKTAIRYFEKAIEQDPEYALAWAGIADSYSLLGEYGNIPRKQLFPKSKEAIENALAIDDQLAEVHTSFASLLMLNYWDWAGAEREFKRALELNPNYATTHHWYSQWLLNMGRLDEAVKMIYHAAELDPVSQAIIKDKGIILYYNRSYDEAIELGLTTLELDPEYASAHRLMSLAYQGLGRYDEAIVENAKWGELTGNQLETRISLAQILAVAGNVKEAKRLAKTAERSRKRTENFNRGMALVSIGLGEHDTAFGWFAKGLEAREESLLSIKVDPKLDPIRDDPRFATLLKKIGLPV